MTAVHQTSTGSSKLADSPVTFDIPLELTNFPPCGFVAADAQKGSNKDESSLHRVSSHGIHSDRGDHEQPSAGQEQPTPTDDATNIVDSFPDGGTRSWLVVLGSFSLLMASYGMMNSVGVFQSYLETNQLSAYSSTDVGWIPSVFVFVTLLLGVLVGPLFDSHGPKMLVYAGSAVFMLSLFLFAECTSYWQFLLCFSVLGGIGAAILSTVAMACVPHWFQVRAGMAIGTALAGSGLGGAVFPLVLRAGFSNIGFKWTMRVLAFVVGVLCFLGSFMVRSRLPRTKASKAIVDFKCFKDLKFTWMTFSTFCLELQYFSFLGMFPTFVTTEGFSTNMSIYLIVIMNVCGVLGRLMAGRLSDRYGRLNTLASVVLLTIIWLFALLYPFSKSAPVLYIFSCLYGISCSSFISLAPVCIRQFSDTKEIGLRFGTCYSVPVNQYTRHGRLDGKSRPGSDGALVWGAVGVDDGATGLDEVDMFGISMEVESPEIIHPPFLVPKPPIMKGRERAISRKCLRTIKVYPEHSLLFPWLHRNHHIPGIRVMMDNPRLMNFIQNLAQFDNPVL
ncbi:hypothetical protein UA08_06130 [Talaromyces atroroseus]|uniref:Major facilitator superfamily (MFS) profile domain-containing protein n=1 Tax=Talaromyces atroroseus TaxID=1441469 RepID=A0A225AY78_TALAT|nr:hypothetical protein UA08_06130 [Talaromyces atroroseus]OKL58437.1 hypothetical protein UA08_06130 [Talaromyces atroroseus]